MWTQIVVTLILLIIGTYAIQFFLPRAGHASAHNPNARWDVAPALGFFGVLLVALSLIEAIRQSIVEIWALGIGLGLILGVVTWVVLYYRPVPTLPKGSALIATFRILRAYGTIIVLAVIGVYLAVRLVGSVVDVFIASAFGLVVVTTALRIFVGPKQIQGNKSL